MIPYQIYKDIGQYSRLQYWYWIGSEKVVSRHKNHKLYNIVSSYSLCQHSYTVFLLKWTLFIIDRLKSFTYAITYLYTKRIQLKRETFELLNIELCLIDLFSVFPRWLWCLQTLKTFTNKDKNDTGQGSG